MRIRKRFPPSSFSSPPLSDPQLNRSPVVQQSTQGNTQAYPDGNLPVEEVNSCSHPSDPTNRPHPRPSDQHPIIGSEGARWVFSYSTKAQDQVKQKELEGEVVEGEGWVDEEKSSNDTRKGSIFGAKVGIELLPPSSSSHQGGVGRWSEGDKVVPLKKRRGSFERRGEEEEKIMEKEKKKRMKSKTNKKCNLQIDGDDEEGNIIDNDEEKKKKRKVRRGNVIMEGSRCSRVNGRGWRCCQKTLVGYSLCEHHLGKGRLRSMTSVRGKDEQLSNTSNLRKQLGRRLLDEEVENDDDDEEKEEEEEEEEKKKKKKKPLMVMKKKMKLGVVKARSISSLLGQTNSGVLFADNNKNSGV